MKYTPHLKLINQRVWKFPEVISMINDTTKKLLETMKEIQEVIFGLLMDYIGAIIKYPNLCRPETYS